MDIVKLKLNEANIKNSHFYLSSVMELIPDEAIGGSNKKALAERLLEIHYGAKGSPVKTDVAGDKKIFRSRGWGRTFFRAHRLNPGDYIVIEKTDDFILHVYPQRD
ncbi:hypothetical protein GCM10025856_21000 [Methylophaga marina]|uniref:TF-B3 domain-containing protein n=1 Tax=Methylophaga marina TaxID=45495 RepID=A0ABP3DBL0_9GAMM|nr:hypothetical protein [Methylophaga marina]BDZ74381.1 hypothetical protein GCM10025856_21000 [Methylophaga marina]